MSAVMIVAILWIALSVPLALLLGRTVRVAEAWERVRAVPAPSEHFGERSSTRYATPPVRSSLGLSRL
jgi:predicted signal transduction protein with EAL and GGDEF domain